MEPIQTDAARPAGPGPWSPTGIALLSLPVLPLGAILHGLNFRRLGRPALGRFVVWRNLLAVELLFLSDLLGVNLPMPGVGFGVGLLYAAYFYKTQAWLFEAQRAAGGRKGSLLVPSLICLAVLLISLVLAVLAAFG